MKKLLIVACAALIGSLLVLTACGQSSARKPITIKGSDTMVILCQRWAETYMHNNPGVTVQVTGGGSGVGIAALINGGTAICAASRPMKAEEKADVKAKRDQDVHEVAVALDGLAIFLNKDNAIAELSLDQLSKIFRGEVTDWKDVGGKPGKIICYGRDNSSGTHLYFMEHVLKNKNFAPEVQSLPGTAAIVQAVSKDPNAIGYGGIGYSPGVKAIKVSAKTGEASVAPTMENVVNGSYPISRSLYFYTAGQPAGDIQAFITWCLGDEGQKVCQEVGYYPVAKK